MTIKWGTRAIRDMRRLAAQDRERIIGKVEQYARDPESLANQVKTLTGSEYRRMRVGDYRVIFGIEYDQTPVVVVLRVRHRREVYG